MSIVPLIKPVSRSRSFEAFKHLHVGMISHKARHYQKLPVGLAGTVTIILTKLLGKRELRKQRLDLVLWALKGENLLNY